MSKIRFKTSELLPKVTQVAQVVNQKNTISILENVLLHHLTGNNMNITASDGETWLTINTMIEHVDGEVKCCINAQRLNTALRSLGTDMDVEVEFNEQSHIAKFKYKSGNFELPFLDAEDYPNPSTTDSETINVELLNEHLSNGLGLTEFATDIDSLHPQFNGIHIDFEKQADNVLGQIVFVSTDTRKLVKYTQKLDVSLDALCDKGFTLSKKASTIILQLLENGQNNDSCFVSFNEQSFSLECNGARMSTRLISGRFPNYNAVIPTNNDKMAIISRDCLISALKRVMSFANQKTLMSTLTFENNQVLLKTQDLDYNTSAQETVDCSYDNEPITIAFPCNGLIEVVKNIRCEQVAIKMSDPTRAGLIIPSSQPVGTEYISIQMPMQIS